MNNMEILSRKNVIWANAQMTFPESDFEQIIVKICIAE